VKVVLDPDQCAQVAAMRKQGRSLRAIASAFGVSVNAVRRAAEVGVPSPPTPKAKPVKQGKAAVKQGTGDPPESLALVNSQIEEVLRDLSTLEDPKVRREYRNLLASLINLRTKLTPPLPEDPEQDRDMLRAAKQAREKLEKLVKARLGRSP
jgi:hypothetical protein